MTKERPTIPSVVRKSVMDEYNHHCAICGKERPQMHHIDENPSNNDKLNLIPLCPNCHLTDQHNPTLPMPAEKLRLFRAFKDPTILKPQFHPLFVRMLFLDNIANDTDKDELEAKARELMDFVAALEMGDFYSKQIKALVEAPSYMYVLSWGGGPDPALDAQLRRKAAEYRDQLRIAREKVQALVVELLRFQRW